LKYYIFLSYRAERKKEAENHAPGSGRWPKNQTSANRKAVVKRQTKRRIYSEKGAAIRIASAGKKRLIFSIFADFKRSVDFGKIGLLWGFPR
jgi:hypothetical protein